MNPAWPMENWPVKPFTTLSETARMTFTPSVVASSQYSCGSRTCRRKSSGAPMRNGSSDRSAARR